MRLGHFLIAGHVKGVKVKYTQNEFLALLNIVGQVHGQMVAVQNERTSAKWFLAQLQCSVHAELLKRMQVKALGVQGQGKVLFRFRHTEAIAILAIYSQPAIVALFAHLPFPRNCVEKTWRALHPNYV